MPLIGGGTVDTPIGNNDDVADTQFTANYSADTLGGDAVAQGWLNHGVHKALPVDDKYGFNRLLKITNNSSAELTGIYKRVPSGIGAAMFSNGFQWNFNMRVDSGTIYHAIYSDASYNGTSGRWLFTQDVTTTNATITVAGVVSVVGGPTDVVSIRLKVDPKNTVGSIYANGVFVTNVNRTSHAITETQVIHSSFSLTSDDEEVWLLNSNFMCMSTADRTITLTIAEVESGIRKIIPNVLGGVEVILPKQTFSIGTSFTLINGSSKEISIKSPDGMQMLFNDKTSIAVEPYGKLDFVMSSFPRGLLWSVSGSK